MVDDPLPIKAPALEAFARSRSKRPHNCADPAVHVPMVACVCCVVAAVLCPTRPQCFRALPTNKKLPDEWQHQHSEDIYLLSYLRRKVKMVPEPVVVAPPLAVEGAPCGSLEFIAELLARSAHAARYAFFGSGSCRAPAAGCPDGCSWCVVSSEGAFYGVSLAYSNRTDFSQGYEIYVPSAKLCPVVSAAPGQV